MSRTDGLIDRDVLALATAIIQSHPRLFADSGLPNDGEQAGVIVAKRAALFVHALRDELQECLPVESAPTCGRRLVEHMSGRATVKMSTEEIMALTRGDIDE